jgi:hypothetical protein
VPPARRSRLLLALGLIALLAAALVWRGAASRVPGDPIGLFTSLPLLWAESEDLGAALRSDTPAHWARAVIEEKGRVVPLDHLAGEGAGSLQGLKRLVIAQPRPLSPEENVALDNWVRGGGQVLLLADPMLTEDSAFPIGDKRRPQDVALLTPILRRWGLEPQFDESQPMGERVAEVMGQPVPVNLSGRFLIVDANACRAWGDGVAASCAIGKGRVFALGDAAVLERGDPEGLRAKAFAGLLDTAFAAR